MRFIVRILDEEDEFQDHARAKCLDLAKNLGTIVRAGPWDHTSILENIKSKKLKKAFSQVIVIFINPSLFPYQGFPSYCWWWSAYIMEKLRCDRRSQHRVCRRIDRTRSDRQRLILHRIPVNCWQCLRSFISAFSKVIQWRWNMIFNFLLSLASSLPEKNKVEQSLLKGK